MTASARARAAAEAWADANCGGHGYWRIHDAKRGYLAGAAAEREAVLAVVRGHRCSMPTHEKESCAEAIAWGISARVNE